MAAVLAAAQTNRGVLLAMATEILNINGWDSGWPTGAVANVDEAIAAADGSVVECATEGDIVVFDLTNTGLTDADTITQLDITFRARETSAASGDNSIDVEFLVGAAVQGNAQNVVLTTDFQDFSLSTDAWDTDWTQAQLDGAQVRCTSVQTGMPSAGGWQVDCLDVVVTYTPDSGAPEFTSRLGLLGYG
jgi:hypothetical protein